MVRRVCGPSLWARFAALQVEDAVLGPVELILGQRSGRSKQGEGF
jgi:hypothetical protein